MQTSTTSPETPLSPAEKRPRRTLNQLGLALLGLVLGGLAQAALTDAVKWEAVVLYILGVFFFVRALGWTQTRSSTLPPYRGLLKPLDFIPSQQSLFGWGLIGLAAVASFIGQVYFKETQSNLRGWQFYGISLALFIAGLFIYRTRYQTSLVAWAKDRFTSGESIKQTIRQTMNHWPTRILFIIVLLAIILRMWNFTEIPFGVWYDEAEAGLQAREWLRSATYKPTFYTPINISGQILILYSWGLNFIANSVYGLRFISVLFGVGGVVCAYLFGKEIGGTTLGLSMAFFLAIMRWDINFSRIAMTGIDTPFFELLTLFYLARLVRLGRLRDAGLAGLAIGFGLSFYTAFRLFIFGLGLFIILGLMLWPAWLTKVKEVAWWRQQFLRGFILTVGLIIALMPVLQFALRHPDNYWSRVQTTAITSRRDDPDLARALRNSTQKHLLMFHVEGDRNGRHNASGEPMLDGVMGLLMIIGFGLALRHYKKPSHLLFIILFPVSLLGGILSLDFEAPQSLRSIGVLPVVAYFCALPVTSLIKEGQRVLRPLPIQWFLVPLAVVAGYIAWLNAAIYFDTQVNDFAVWNAYSTSESITGQEMAELGPDYEFYLSPFLADQPTVSFLSPETPRYNTLTLPNALPLRQVANRPAALFIHPDDQWVFSEAQRLYPSARFERIPETRDNQLALYKVVISENDILALQGLALRYWAGSEIVAGQIPVRTMEVATINEDWAAAIPTTAPFVAEWEGILYAPVFGNYQFNLTNPGEATLEIDGESVFNGLGDQTVTYQLAQGNHHFRLVIKANEVVGQVQLEWQIPNQLSEVIPANAFYNSPVSNNGLLGEYYADPDWQGDPALMRLDPFIDIYFHLTPLERPYTVIWRGFLDIPFTGVYALGLESVGEASLLLDGEPFFTVSNPNEYIEYPASLETGLHKLEIRFQDTLHRSQIHLMWRPPGVGVPDIIPSQNLWPPHGEGWQPPSREVATTPQFEGQTMFLNFLTTLNEGLIEPRDVAVNLQGNVYVADTGFKGVFVFNEGRLVRGWNKTVDGNFEEPVALVTTNDNRVWVLDSTLQWVYNFDAEGVPLGKLGGPEAALYHPRGLTRFDEAQMVDTLAIADTGSGRITLYDMNGVKLGTVSTLGTAPGQLNEPVDVLRDPFGAYLVTEGANVNRWQRVDALGQSLGVWPVEAPPALDGSHLAWGPDGSILMTNSAKGVLSRYSPSGDLLDEWRSIGPITFNKPVGIFVDPATNRLYITDVGNRTVYVFVIELPEQEIIPEQEVMPDQEITPE